MKKISVLMGVLVMVITLFALPIFNAVNATTRYVAPGGDNANPGTEGSPWRTIVYAVSNSNSGDIIKLMDDDNDGTKDYSEIDWVFVNKQLTIERYDDDATKPWVYTQVPSKHVFSIASDYVTISGLKITGATGTSQAGISVGPRNYCTFNDNDVTNNYYGIYLYRSNHCNITDNNVSYNNSTSGVGESEGIFLSSSSENTLSGNTVNYNRKTGIDINGTSTEPSTNNALNNNTVNHNGSSGINLSSYATNTSLENNTVNSNTYDGIYIGTFSSNNHNISNNTTSYNGRYGIGVSSGSNNTVSGNTSESNTKDGIYLNSTSGNNLTDNICRSNNEYGIYLGYGSNTIRGNLIENNNSYGIYITSDGSPDLGSVDSGNEGRNTIRNNDSGTYQVYNNTDNTIYAYWNYWVHTDFDVIDNHIYDNDESGSAMGSVLFSPWLESDQSLPVSLVSFSAHAEGRSVILNWITESETDNLGFILERSAGMDWQTIASYQTHDELKGQGNTSSRTEYTFTDQNVESGKEYAYRLSDVSTKGEITVYDALSITLDKLPETTEMKNAYPNPFNPDTYIEYQLSEDTDVNITVFDMLGRQVKILYYGHQLAGSYHVYWTGTDERGNKVPSGGYIIQMRTEKTKQTQKIMLMK